jgi:zinc protease
MPSSCPALRLVALFAVFVLACRGPETGIPAIAPAASVVPPPPPAPVTAASSGPAAPPSGAPAESEPLPLWDAVRKRRLPSGLTTCVMRHPHPPGRVQVWLALDVGAIDEADDERGLAHLVEHMAFSGTRRFPGPAVVTWAEGVGMRFGAHVNAFTSFDATVFQLEVPAGDPSHLGRALDILRDWATDISFEPAALDRERVVVLEERRLSRGVAERLFERHLPVLFKGSRYADREPIGLPEVVSGASREAILAWYRRSYRPDRMAVLVVGDVDPDAAEAALASRFADLPAPDSRLPPGPTTPSLADRAQPSPEADLPAPGLRVSIVTDPELPRPSLSWYELLPRRPETTRADYRRALCEMLWQLIVGERLAALSRAPDAPFEAASFGIDTPLRPVDILAGEIAPKPGLLLEALSAVLRERRRVELSGFTPDEVARARANLLRFYEDYDRGFETTESQLFADELTRHLFEGELMVGAKAEKAMALALIPAISEAEIARAARPFAESDRQVLLVSAPSDAALPAEEAFRAAIATALAATALPRPAAAPTERPLVAQPPAGGVITAERAIPALGVTALTLSNGVRVLVKPTDFERDGFTLSAASPGGYAAVPDADWDTARFALAALADGGLGDLDPVALGKALAGRSASAEAWVSDTLEGVSGGGSSQDIETALSLAWLSLTAPRVDLDAFDRWKTRQLSVLETEAREPERRFALELTEALSSNHLRARRATPEAIRRLDPARALAFHRARFGDLGDLVVAIVGDVELATLRPLLARWFGALPAGVRREAERDVGLRMPSGVIRRVWRLGSESRASVHLRFHADEAWDRDGERDLRILSEVLALRLRARLREDLGAVYGVDVSASFTRVPVGRRVLAIDFGCDPARVEDLLEATHAVLAEVARDGVDAGLLSRVREQTLRSRETQLRANTFWAEWLVAATRLGEDPSRVLDPAPLLARLTSEHVRAAARRFALVPADARSAAARRPGVPVAPPGASSVSAGAASGGPSGSAPGSSGLTSLYEAVRLPGP